MKLIPFRTVEKQLLKDPKFRRAYEKLEPEFALIRQILDRRLKLGLSQTQLAKKLGTKQSAVARLESGNYNPTVKQLQKIASALDARLTITIS